MKIFKGRGTPSLEFWPTMKDLPLYKPDYPQYQPALLSKLVPTLDELGLDLLDKMLVFNPLKRWNIKQCLEHPYFNGLHNPEEEPVASQPFDWSFDNFEPTKEILQNMIYEEALKFHPA